MCMTRNNFYNKSSTQGAVMSGGKGINATLTDYIIFNLKESIEDVQTKIKTRFTWEKKD